MEYDEAERVLFELPRSDARSGTASAAALWAELGNPGSDIRFVQVAGSNGKGSTAKLTESILREAGFSVGLFTSPHLETLDERIRVDGEPIPEDAVAEYVERIQPWLAKQVADGNSPTFFEVITVMGLWYFARRGVDVAVLEVGVGGADDATSIVDPVASCVTTASLEHTGALGETVAEIAAIQAGVAPSGETPLVTGATGTTRALIRVAADDVLTVGEPKIGGPEESDEQPDISAQYEGRTGSMVGNISIEISAGIIDHPAFADGMSFATRLTLLGAHQARNAAIATALSGQVVTDAMVDSDDRGEAVDDSAASIDADVLSRGLRNARWPGRFEVIDRDPLVILDGAHNPEAIEALSQTLATIEYNALHIVFGAMTNKAHTAMVDALPAATAVRTCQPPIDRAAAPATLARMFENAGYERVSVGDDVAAAVTTARDQAAPSDCVLVTGSLFVVGAARSMLAARPVTPDTGG